jgi:hypothetical protein
MLKSIQEVYTNIVTQPLEDFSCILTNSGATDVGAVLVCWLHFILGKAANVSGHRVDVTEVWHEYSAVILDYPLSFFIIECCISEDDILEPNIDALVRHTIYNRKRFCELTLCLLPRTQHRRQHELQTVGAEHETGCRHELQKPEFPAEDCW